MGEAAGGGRCKNNINTANITEDRAKKGFHGIHTNIPGCSRKLIPRTKRPQTGLLTLARRSTEVTDEAASPDEKGFRLYVVNFY